MVKLCRYRPLLSTLVKKREEHTGETRLEDPGKLLGYNRDSTPRVIICQGILFQQLNIELNSLLSKGKKKIKALERK